MSRSPPPRPPWTTRICSRSPSCSRTPPSSAACSPSCPRGRAGGITPAPAAAGLWLEALDLLNHLHKRQRKEMVLAALALGEPALQAILDTIVEHELWDEVRLIAEHDDSIRERLA